MKILFTTVAFLLLSIVSTSQCAENITGRQMEKGMLIYSYIDSSSANRYVAEVTAVSGTTFSCRFLHSNSVYQFKDLRKIENAPPTRMMATVVSSKGGGYSEGQNFILNVYMPDPDACDITGKTGDIFDIIATFPDKKKYLGRMQTEVNGHTIKFAHTKSIYTLDRSFKTTKVTGGGYPVGTVLKVVHARVLQF